MPHIITTHARRFELFFPPAVVASFPRSCCSTAKRGSRTTPGCMRRQRRREVLNTEVLSSSVITSWVQWTDHKYVLWLFNTHHGDQMINPLHRRQTSSTGQPCYMFWRRQIGKGKSQTDASRVQKACVRRQTTALRCKMHASRRYT